MHRGMIQPTALPAFNQPGIHSKLRAAAWTPPRLVSAHRSGRKQVVLDNNLWVHSLHRRSAFHQGPGDE